ncbi:hypothetical protein IE53DRAFT_360543 [Violaceomyces palustris]|uniref:Uncharacterized protein n=1 Tax=Violaceomyces palustris TaxID=1673888 RepID=A0ACD0P3S1_9BASI|nr:hypothetical protein IE53DRAFT_360543 [Violaceomyces palustris]
MKAFLPLMVFYLFSDLVTSSPVPCATVGLIERVQPLPLIRRDQDAGTATNFEMLTTLKQKRNRLPSEGVTATVTMKAEGREGSRSLGKRSPFPPIFKNVSGILSQAKGVSSEGRASAGQVVNVQKSLEQGKTEKTKLIDYTGPSDFWFSLIFLGLLAAAAKNTFFSPKSDQARRPIANDVAHGHVVGGSGGG